MMINYLIKISKSGKVINLKKKNPIFTTIVRNDEGLEGTAYVVGGDFKVLTSSPTNNKPGTNPEELIGLAWSTCLNASIEYALKRRQIKNVHSEVEIQIDYLREGNSDQTYFKFKVSVLIDLPQTDAEEIAAEAHSRCPVSKIVGEYPHYEMKVTGIVEK